MYHVLHCYTEVVRQDSNFFLQGTASLCIRNQILSALVVVIFAQLVAKCENCAAAAQRRLN